MGVPKFKGDERMDREIMTEDEMFERVMAVIRDLWELTAENGESFKSFANRFMEKYNRLWDESGHGTA